MPTYEFECPTGHRFEHFYRKISEAPSELACPQCGQTAARRFSPGAGLIFKGSGFYITDYGKDGKKPRTTAPAAEGEAKPESKAEGTAESKGETSSATPAKSDASDRKRSERKPAPAPKDSSGSE